MVFASLRALRLALRHERPQPSFGAFPLFAPGFGGDPNSPCAASLTVAPVSRRRRRWARASNPRTNLVVPAWWSCSSAHGPTVDHTIRWATERTTVRSCARCVQPWCLLGPCCHTGRQRHGDPRTPATGRTRSLARDLSRSARDQASAAQARRRAVPALTAQRDELAGSGRSSLAVSGQILVAGRQPIRCQLHQVHRIAGVCHAAGGPSSWTQRPRWTKPIAS